MARANLGWPTPTQALRTLRMIAFVVAVLTTYHWQIPQAIVYIGPFKTLQQPQMVALSKLISVNVVSKMYYLAEQTIALSVLHIWTGLCNLLYASLV